MKRLRYWTCNDCKYKNNPNNEQSCLYCRKGKEDVRYNGAGIKHHFGTLIDAIKYVEKNMDKNISPDDITATDRNYHVYNSLYPNERSIIINVNPMIHDNDKFNSIKSQIGNYEITDVVQTHKSIMLIMLKAQDPKSNTHSKQRVI